ncbi:MAG: nucleoside triphosphate pyrophosphohydrolase [Candidatus Poribacteria bacterium]|nr:MAG: nucleoside triphosphate pyrophosphohydrolase [Candidatus Poribacteria bacterium]
MQEKPQPTAEAAFARLLEIVAILRSERGCPWDREQTHHSLRSDTLEEAYELVEAIEEDRPEKIAEELGDLMIVVALHAQIAAEAGHFTMAQLLNAANAKLVRRHPHVFGDLQVESTDQVLRNWEQIKRQEESNQDRTSLLDGIPRALPALLAAEKLQKRAARVGFDWEEPTPILGKIREEANELQEQIEKGADPERLEDEIGDLLFAVVNLARKLHVDPEQALRRTNAKFRRRFQRMEALLQEQGEPLEGKSLQELDQLWEQAKAEENG